MNKTALVISAVLTAFLLAIAGGVFYTVRGAELAKAAEQANAQAAQVLDPQIQQEIQQREANYQNLIAQANERLMQSQQKQQELQAQLATLQNTAVATAQAPSQLTVAPEQAAQIAAQYLNQSSVYSVETTTLKGAMAYKVTFSSGDIAYVSMDGQFIGVQPAPVVQPSTRILAHNGGGEQEQESGGNDD